VLIFIFINIKRWKVVNFSPFLLIRNNRMKFKRFGNGSYKSREIEQNYSIQIICKGFSDTRKFVLENSDENYSINRRVEVVFY